MTDLAIAEQSRESLLLGTRLLELGSHAVEQPLCLSLFEEQGSLLFFRQSLPKLDGFGPVDFAALENSLAARRRRQSLLQLPLKIVELAADLTLPERRLEPTRRRDVPGCQNHRRNAVRVIEQRYALKENRPPHACQIGQVALN